LIQNSPKRKLTERVSTSRLACENPRNTSKAKHSLNLQDGKSQRQPEQDTPRVTLIPARVKEKVDFPNPPNLLP